MALSSLSTEDSLLTKKVSYVKVASGPDKSRQKSKQDMRTTFLISCGRFQAFDIMRKMVAEEGFTSKPTFKFIA